MESENPEPQKRENSLYSLLFNIALPVIILSKGDKFIPQPAMVLVLALSFPIVYFIWDYRRRGKRNFISIIGFVSVLLTGGIGLLQLPRMWFIIKETAIPAIIGIAILISVFTKRPLIRLLVFSREFFDVDHIESALRERGTTQQMESLLKKATALLSVSFFISAVLNFILASHFVKTEPGIDAAHQAQFNAEVGAMTGWSFVVIAAPSTVFLLAILWIVGKGITRLTGLKMEEYVAHHLREEVAEKDASK